MNKEKLVGMICKERLQTLEENPPNFWNKESPHTLFICQVFCAKNYYNETFNTEEK